jgi:DNA-binding transcriptional regulator YbjK
MRASSWAAGRRRRSYPCRACSTEGVRALTHRAVDAAAAVPTGSTANYFKTRDMLISAVADRFADRDRATWQAIAGFVRPTTAVELAAALAAYVHRALGSDRALTIARYALFVEAALRPDLQGRLAEAARSIRPGARSGCERSAPPTPRANARQSSTTWTASSSTNSRFLARPTSWRRRSRRRCAGCARLRRDQRSVGGMGRTRPHAGRARTVQADGSGTSWPVSQSRHGSPRSRVSTSNIGCQRPSGEYQPRV